MVTLHNNWFNKQTAFSIRFCVFDVMQSSHVTHKMDVLCSDRVCLHCGDTEKNRPLFLDLLFHVTSLCAVSYVKDYTPSLPPFHEHRERIVQNGYIISFVPDALPIQLYQMVACANNHHGTGQTICSAESMLDTYRGTFGPHRASRR